MKNRKNILIAVGLLAAVFVVGLIVGKVTGGNSQPQEPENVGNAGTRWPHGISVGSQVTSASSNGFILGTNGTEVIKFNTATTTLIGAGTNTYQVTASSTKAIDFVCTNVTSNDIIHAWWAPTTTPAVYPDLGWTLAYAVASSTANRCTAYITNVTGATASIPNELASSTAYSAWTPED